MRITDFPLILEAKEHYIEARREGNSRHDATQQVIEFYAEEILTDPDGDGVCIWIGLADGQYYRKELEEQIAAKGLWALTVLESSEADITPGDILRRRSHYAQAPMSEKAVGKPRPKFRCSWAVGDTFAFLLSGSDAEAVGLMGRYILLRKVGEMEDSGRIMPSVSLTLWDDRPLPKNSEEFKEIPILILDCRPYIPKGYYEYRASLVIKNKKQIDALNLEYLGNFPDVDMPNDEAIITRSGWEVLLLPEYLEYLICCQYKLHLHLSKERESKPRNENIKPCTEDVSQLFVK